MFKNWFKRPKGDNRESNAAEEKIIEQSVHYNKIEEISTQENSTDYIQENIMPNMAKQEEENHKNIEVIEDINSNKELKTSNKPKHKATEKFIEYKKFYKDKFEDCRSINEVFEVYIENTYHDDLLDELRLRYISMYLFNTGLTDDKWSTEKVKYNLDKFSSPNYKFGESVIEGDIVNEKLYIELKEYIEDRILIFQHPKTDINIDGILLLIFSKYGMASIDSDYFLEILLKVIADIDLPEIQTGQDNLRNYLKKRILNIKDIQFWEEDEEKIYRCEVTFVGRCLEIKTPDLIHTIQQIGEDPIYVSALPIEDSNMFSVFIEDTIFIMNPYDKNRTLSYFEYINNEILEEINKKAKVIGEEISTMPQELNEMVKIFLNIMPLDILLDIEYYIAFEHLISFNNFMEKQFLDSRSEQRDIIIENLKEDEKTLNALNNFIDGDYKKLIKLAGKYIDLPQKYHSLVIWKLIREESVQFISEYWKNEYGIYFKEDIQAINLDEYVDLYCKCVYIPTKSANTAGAFTYYLMGRKMFPLEINENFIDCYSYLVDKMLNRFEELELEEFENRLANTQVQEKEIYTINDIDLMNGYEFEQFVSLLFMKMGYVTEITKGSGDQGMDIIAERNGIKVGVQAKCYSNKVTNKAVQEIFAALNHYDCNKGMVVTNNYFTDSAIELAESNNIILWDRDILKRKIEEIF